MDGPIALSEAKLAFDDLASLRDISRQIVEAADVSLGNYYDEKSGGFYHVLGIDDPKGKNDPGDFSKSSTATVVEFLVHAGLWSSSGPRVAATQKLLNRVFRTQNWASAGLPEGNPFTVAFLLELVASLMDAGGRLTEKQGRTVTSRLKSLRAALEKGKGTVGVKGEQPNAFLTQLVVRVLLRWSDRNFDHVKAPAIEGTLRGQVLGEALASIDRELALVASVPRDADVFELGYAILIVDSLGGPDKPAERKRLARGLDYVFAAQRDDGTWPRGRRLFHYPAYGNAYCHEYEFLTQLVRALQNRNYLRNHFLSLRQAIDRLVSEAAALPSGGFGWSSGHHLQLRYPESWATASCFHFCYLLDRVASDAVVDSILEYLQSPHSIQPQQPDPSRFDTLLDSPVVTMDGKVSLKEIVKHSFIDPVLRQRSAVQEGRPLDGATNLSAILFGPPGTAKTSYAQAIADAIGWRLISVDPSHVIRHGLDNIQREMNNLFRMFTYAERIVVLFDEIDELVRDRSSPAAEAGSRFLTTAMLPRIAELRRTRRILFLVATNHLEVFDAAIRRPGRFDLILPVMPPSFEAKMSHRPGVRDLLDRVSLLNDSAIQEAIEKLTFAEFEVLTRNLSSVRAASGVRRTVDAAKSTCLLDESVAHDEKQTWAELIADQRSRITLSG